MPTPLLLMILLGAAVLYWSAARAAAERAEQLGRDACQSSGVQLLDQTVHADGWRLRRGYNGHVGFERSFRFEYSIDGSDRYIGRLVLRGKALVAFSGPAQAASVVNLH